MGGGTAGWLTAAWLAKHLGHGPGGVQVTLIESSDIPTIGVGEGTFPTIAKTLAALGVDEAEFMRESSAAFKQGIRFVDWVHAQSAGRAPLTITTRSRCRAKQTGSSCCLTGCQAMLDRSPGGGVDTAGAGLRRGARTQARSPTRVIAGP